MTARAAGIGGFEWMEGIPGNVGGGLRMNAGAMGVQTFDQVVSVRLLDAHGELQVKSREEMTAHYRHVPELATHYAVSAVFRGTAGAASAQIDAGWPNQNENAAPPSRSPPAPAASSKTPMTARPANSSTNSAEPGGGGVDVVGQPGGGADRAGRGCSPDRARLPARPPVRATFRKRRRPCPWHRSRAPHGSPCRSDS